MGNLYIEDGYVNDGYIQTGITINWGNGVIFIPKSELTLVQLAPTEIYELNLNSFRLILKDLEDDSEGMPYPITHVHNTEVSLGGLTYARVIEVIAPYTITFENGQYAVNLVGANSNVGDRVNVNQVSIRSANSAGMISSPDIEYSSFDGGVTYDSINGVGGTSFPTGTPRQPSNNILDSGLIAEYRGFTKGYIIGSLDMDDTVEMTGFTLIGEGGERTNINIQDEALVENCSFYNAHITGVLDGNSRITECLLTTIHYINGFIERCILYPGIISLGGGGDAHFLDCWSGIPGVSTPVIDLGGSGQGLTLRNYSGGIKLINKTGTESVSIDLVSGQVKIDLTTVTDGLIIVRGTGKVTDSNTGEYLSSGNYGDLIILNELVSSLESAKAVANIDLSLYTDTNTLAGSMEHLKHVNYRIYVDTDADANGNGSQEHPFDNQEDTIDHAEEKGIKDIYVYSDMEITRNLKNFVVVGVGTPLLELINPDLKKSEFSHCKLTGTYTDTITAQECELDNVYVNGTFENCAIRGLLIVPDGGSAYITECTPAVFGFDKPIYDVGTSIGTGQLLLMGYKGSAVIRNVNHADDIAKVVLDGGTVIIENTCTQDDVIFIIGNGRVINQSSCIVNTDNLINTQIITDSVWSDQNAVDIINDLSFIKNIEGGRWHITNNEMIFYADDNTTEIARFSLLDSADNPTEVNVFQRFRQ